MYTSLALDHYLDAPFTITGNCQYFTLLRYYVWMSPRGMARSLVVCFQLQIFTDCRSDSKMRRATVRHYSSAHALQPSALIYAYTCVDGLVKIDSVTD